MIKLVTVLWVALLAVPALAHADWQGTMHVDGAGSESPIAGAQGKMYFQWPNLRMEMNTHGQHMVLLSNMKTGKHSMLMPSQKLVMDIPSNLQKQVINCTTQDVDRCLKQRGYRQVGKGNAEGHPCVIYEGTEHHGKYTIHQKIWRPTDLKEVFMVKAVSHDQASNKDITTRIDDIKVGKLNKTLFEVPAGYHSMKMPHL